MSPEERRIAELEGQVAGLLWLQVEEDEAAFDTWARRWKALAWRL